MATCSLLGQAVGNAAALCVKYECDPRDISREHIHELQQEILYDGVFLPGVKREVSALTMEAKLNLSASDREILFNGMDRPYNDDELNGIMLDVGSEIVFSYDTPRKINTLRLCLDPDYSRESVSKNFKMRVFAQKLHQGHDFEPVKVAATIVKEITVYGDDKVIFSDDNNYSSLLKIPVDGTYSSVRVVFGNTHGSEKICVFGCDMI